MNVIEIRNLCKTYNGSEVQVTAVNSVNLDFSEGEFTAIVGPSGSGKTTLLNMIGGLDTPSMGEIIIAGTNLSLIKASELINFRLHHIGFVFQAYNLIPVLTAFENVELPLLLTKLSKAERRKHVEATLEIVGLGDRIHHYPKQLSGGQEQRVAIARAIVTDPVLLVADEPTGDLDRNSAEEILTLMERLNKEFKKTILMVTHDPHAAQRARIIRHLDKGDLTEGVEYENIKANL